MVDGMGAQVDVSRVRNLPWVSGERHFAFLPIPLGSSLRFLLLTGSSLSVVLLARHTVSRATRDLPSSPLPPPQLSGLDTPLMLMLTGTRPTQAHFHFEFRARNNNNGSPALYIHVLSPFHFFVGMLGLSRVMHGYDIGNERRRSRQWKEWRYERMTLYVRAHTRHHPGHATIYSMAMLRTL